MLNDDRRDGPVAGERRLPFSRILVTGADGFVGRHLVPALQARLGEDARITLATRVPNKDGDLPQIGFDLSDPATISTAIAAVRPDLVVHLAAQASVGQSLGGAANTWSINLVGTLALANALAEIVPECTLLFISSAEVYGQTYNQEVATEQSALRPQSAYSRSKAAAEAMLADVLPASARLIVVRPSNHSGPGQDERFVVATFAAQIARIERAVAGEMLVGNLDAERDFMDVRDVVCGYVALLCNAEALPLRSLFNIASGHSIRIGDILDRMIRMSPAVIKIRQDPQRMRASEVPRAALDASAFREAADWQPHHDLEATLLDVLSEQRARLRA